MKKISFIALIGLAFIFADCKSKSSTKSSAGTTVVESATFQGEKTIKYRFIISFTSHASGIDGEKYDVIDKYIQKHSKKPAYDLIAMGREGERDMCFHLKELNPTEQKVFIDEIKKLAQGSERVVLSENAERVKKQQ